MKDLDPAVFLSVFQEMLGVWLYVMAVVALITTLLFLRAILQEHGLSAKRLVWSQVAGLAGGIAALLFMWAVTHSSWRDIGGPVDLLLVAAIYLAGWGGSTMLFYAVTGAIPHQREY